MPLIIILIKQRVLFFSGSSKVVCDQGSTGTTGPSALLDSTDLFCRNERTCHISPIGPAGSE